MNGGHEWGEAIMSMLTPGVAVFITVFVAAAGRDVVAGLRAQERGRDGTDGDGAGSDAVR